MDRSYSCPFPILCCLEDNSSIVSSDDEGDSNGGADGGRSRSRAYALPLRGGQQNGGDGALMALPLQSEECLSLLVLRESEHLPREDYARRLQTRALDASLRRDAIAWIEKQGKAWMIQLLSVACLSLAAKMEETEVPLSLDLQVGKPRFIFEARTIQRMELLVLSTLKWRMQTVTPFSFIDYFLHKFSSSKQLPEALLSQSVKLILGTTQSVDFLEFRPSEVAAAVALSQHEETERLDIGDVLCCCNLVNKERVLRCNGLIQEMVPMQQRSMKGISVSISSGLQSPIGVLDVACLSCKSDDTATIGSQANSEHTSPVPKRRKLEQTECLNA